MSTTQKTTRSRSKKRSALIPTVHRWSKIELLVERPQPRPEGNAPNRISSFTERTQFQPNPRGITTSHPLGINLINKEIV